ncbi:Atp-dependent protease la, partial [Globisporangium splendens]
MVLRVFWNVGAGLVHRALNKSAIKPGMAVKYPAVWRARPGFMDCDINLHLNNASYLFNMELARWHFSASTGILYHALKNRRTFLAGSQVIRYRHAIPPFRPYEIRSQIVFADETWIYFLQQFQCPTTGKLYAEGLCRVTVREGKKVIPASVMLEEVEPERIELPTEMPDVVKEFLDWDAASKVSMETIDQREKRELAAPSNNPSTLFKAAGNEKTQETTTSPGKQPAPRGFFANLTRSMNLPF